MPNIALNLIEPDAHNVRITKAEPQKDADLVASIKALGVIQSILVYALHPDDVQPGGPQYRIIAGERRWHAAQAAGLTEIPAEVSDEQDMGRIRLMQLAENARREQMSALDIWGGVHAAAQDGASDASIALAMGRTERDVARYRLMGNLHPDIQDYIRTSGDMPSERQLREIAQASHEQQAAALAACKLKNHVTIWRIAELCVVRRIPMDRARFNPKLYTAITPVFSDLFENADAPGHADDIDLFMRLQNEWADAEIARRLKAGWGKAQRAQRNANGEAIPPKGVARWDYQNVDKQIKKADRAGWMYEVDVRPDGRVAELLWPIPAKLPDEPEAPAKPDKAAQAQAAAETGAGAFTNGGVMRLGHVKRDALATFIRGDGPQVRDLDVVVALLATLLRERLGYGAPTAGGAGLMDGNAFRTEGKVEELVAWSRKLAAQAVTSDVIPFSVVERLGEWLGAPVSYPATPMDLAHLKGPGIEAIGKALGWEKPPATQKAARLAIAEAVPVLTADHLPIIGWQLEKARPEATAQRVPQGINDPGDDYPEGCTMLTFEDECTAETCACEKERGTRVEREDVEEGVEA